MPFYMKWAISPSDPSPLVRMTMCTCTGGGTALGVEYETYTDAALAERFPYLAFEPGSLGLYQPHTAGHVSPRARRCAPRRP